MDGVLVSCSKVAFMSYFSLTFRWSPCFIPSWASVKSQRHTWVYVSSFVFRSTNLDNQRSFRMPKGLEKEGRNPAFLVPLWENKTFRKIGQSLTQT